MNTQQQPSKPQGFIIFSAQQAGADYHVNSQNHAALLHRLTALGINYKEVKGCYEGVRETAVILDISHEYIAERFCNQFEQESYLRVNTSNRNEAWLVYNNVPNGGQVEQYIGRFKSITAWQADKSAGWTMDPTTGTYYTCV